MFPHSFYDTEQVNKSQEPQLSVFLKLDLPAEPFLVMGCIMPSMMQRHLGTAITEVITKLQVWITSQLSKSFFFMTLNLSV